MCVFQNTGQMSLKGEFQTSTLVAPLDREPIKSLILKVGPFELFDGCYISSLPIFLVLFTVKCPK